MGPNRSLFGTTGARYCRTAGPHRLGPQARSPFRGLTKALARRFGACKSPFGPTGPRPSITGGELMSDASTSLSKPGYVLSIGMQKGGVSKTTNACHLAVALGELGRRVLLWDVDENYGATKVFQIPPDAFFTTMSVLTGDSSAEEAVLAFDDDDLDVDLPQGVDFIPSSRALQGVDRALSAQDKFYNPNECLHPHLRRCKSLAGLHPEVALRAITPVRASRVQLPLTPV